MRVVYYVVSAMKAYTWVQERTSPLQRRIALGVAAWAGRQVTRRVTGRPLTKAQRRALEKRSEQAQRDRAKRQKQLEKSLRKKVRT